MRQAHRTITRLGAVVVAAVAAVAVWVVVDPIGGIALRAPAPGGDGDTHALNVATVLMPALVASLAGWALLAALEWLTTRARASWTVTAVAVFLLSLSGPLTATGLTGTNQAALALMHIAVAATLIPLLAHTSPSHRTTEAKMQRHPTPTAGR